MSIIMPAGNSKLKWAPEAEEAKLEKTASAETDVEVKEASEEAAEEIEENPLYEAAKEYFEQKETKEASVTCKCNGGDCECGDDCETCKCEGGTCKEACGAMSDELPEVIDEVPEIDAVDDVEVDVVDDLEGGEEAPATVEEAVEAVEEAVEDLKEVAGVEEGVDVEDEEVEIEIDVVDEPEEEEEDIIIESTPMLASDETEGVEKEASAEDDWVKLSMISPKNRSKIVSFWKDMLGYPADYVNLMAKDYEK